MATYSKLKLSGSTDGKQIKVVATATAGTTLHTAVSGTTDYDEIWIWATNSSASDLKLTVEFGGTTAPDDLIEMTIPAESGPIPVIPGLVLHNGSVVRGFAASANLILVSGFVNRITA